MDNVINSTSGNIELPKTQGVGEQLNINDNIEQNIASPEIKITPQSERLVAASQALSQVADDAQTATTTNPAVINNNDASGQNPIYDDSSSLIADDVDVIEKIWVQKAKNIVDQTKEDPHKQSKELSNIKRIYINKRFNKDIKVADG